MRRALCGLCTQRLVGRTGSERSTSHVFLQGEGAARDLVGGGAGAWLIGARARCEPGITWAQGRSPPYSRWVWLRLEDLGLHFWPGSTFPGGVAAFAGSRVKGGAEASLVLVGVIGQSWQGSHSKQQLSICCLCSVTESNQACLCTVSSVESQWLPALWWAPLVLKAMKGILLSGSRPKV